MLFAARREPSLRIDEQHRHDHEEQVREIGTARCARELRPTTRSKWQRKGDGLSAASGTILAGSFRRPTLGASTSGRAELTCERLNEFRIEFVRYFPHGRAVESHTAAFKLFFLRAIAYYHVVKVLRETGLAAPSLGWSFHSGII